MHKLSLLLFVFLFQISNSQELPLGYIKYFETHHTNSKKQNQFINSSHASISEKDGIYKLELKNDSLEGFLPQAAILVDNLILGDYIAEVSLKTTTEIVDSLSGLYVLSGMRDSANYYFVQLNEKGAGFYKMYKGEISLIKYDSSFTLKNETWHKLRIKRDILTRSIRISNKNSFVEFKDPNLIMGYMGFGINNNSLAMRHLTIWAPTAIKKPTSIFVQ